VLSFPAEGMGLAPGSLELVVKERRNETVVCARGEIDMASSVLLTTVLHRVSRLDAPVRLDLADVEFLDSSSFHAVEAASRTADRLGRALAIGPLSEAVTRVFKLAAIHGGRTPGLA